MNNTTEIQILQYKLKLVEDSNRIIFNNINNRLLSLDQRLKELEHAINVKQ